MKVFNFFVVWLTPSLIICSLILLNDCIDEKRTFTWEKILWYGRTGLHQISLRTFSIRYLIGPPKKIYPNWYERLLPGAILIYYKFLKIIGVPYFSHFRIIEYTNILTTSWKFFFCHEYKIKAFMIERNILFRRLWKVWENVVYVPKYFVLSIKHF